MSMGVRVAIPIGPMTFGGYSKVIISDKHFVFKLPSNLDPAAAAPLLCAGVTMFYPLEKFNLGPGKVVGIAGIGGLGHLGIKMAKARGCTVIALTTSEWKVLDAVKSLGADDAVLMTDLGKIDAYKNTMDIIINTIPVPHDPKFYYDMIKPFGTLHVVGDMNTIPTTEGRHIFWYNKSMSGSNVAGVPDTKRMLEFCSANNIVATGEVIDIKVVNEHMQRMVDKRLVIDTLLISKLFNI